MSDLQSGIIWDNALRKWMMRIVFFQYGIDKKEYINSVETRLFDNIEDAVKTYKDIIIKRIDSGYKFLYGL